MKILTAIAIVRNADYLYNTQRLLWVITYQGAHILSRFFGGMKTMFQYFV